MGDGITKTERAELRSVVKTDFRVLEDELNVRQAELMAEIERQVLDHFHADDDVVNEAKAAVEAIVNEANERIAEVVDAAQGKTRHTCHFAPLRAPYIEWTADKRQQLRRAMVADLEARVADARHRLRRQSADMLKRLAVGALASEEAHTFMASIPTVGELVPESRLAELEASLAAPDVPAIEDEPKRRGRWEPPEKV